MPIEEIRFRDAHRAEVAEQSRIAALLDEALAGRSGALVIRGEAGIGKSALLFEAASTDQFHVLRARGLETESEIPFSGLHDLLAPILDARSQLPNPQAEAIGSALSVGPPVPVERLAICAGVLGLLSAASRQHPVMVVIDDAHLLDHPSSDAGCATSGVWPSLSGGTVAQSPSANTRSSRPRAARGPSRAGVQAGSERVPRRVGRSRKRKPISYWARSQNPRGPGAPWQRDHPASMASGWRRRPLAACQQSRSGERLRAGGMLGIRRSLKRSDDCPRLMITLSSTWAGELLIEGLSGTGKTSVCDELQRRGYHAIHGDRELAYQAIRNW